MILKTGTVFQSDKFNLSIESIWIDDSSTYAPNMTLIKAKTWRLNSVPTYDHLEPMTYDEFMAYLDVNDYLATKYIDDRLYQVVNPDDRDIADNLFLVSFAQIVTPMAVWAHHEGDAIDIFADFAQEKGWLGYFLDDHDAADYHPDDIIHVGNESLMIFSGELYVKHV